MPTLERYWSEANPEFSDGEGAESFSTLLDRTRATLDWLQIATLSLTRPSSSHGPAQELNKRAVHDVARFELRPMADALDRQETPEVGGALRDVRLLNRAHPHQAVLGSEGEKRWLSYMGASKCARLIKIGQVIYLTERSKEPIVSAWTAPKHYSKLSPTFLNLRIAVSS